MLLISSHFVLISILFSLIIPLFPFLLRILTEKASAFRNQPGFLCAGKSLPLTGPLITTTLSVLFHLLSTTLLFFLTNFNSTHQQIKSSVNDMATSYCPPRMYSRSHRSSQEVPIQAIS